MATQWVIKATKFCNLRCQYCYEYPNLGNKEKMSFDQLRFFFENIGSYYMDNPVSQDFVWHGGEPLLLGEDYLNQVFQIQKEIMDHFKIPYTNSIQTNLYKFSKEDLELLKQFSNIGVSVDVFGDLRVNLAGKSVQEKVMKNMQTLLDNGVRFGCISVLSKENINSVPKIYDFFTQLNLSFRLLPIYRTGFSGQQENLGLSAKEILDAYVFLLNKWVLDESLIQIMPIQDYINCVIKKYLGDLYCLGHYSKKKSESLFIMDTNGELFSNADAYQESYSYGNIFIDSLGNILESKGFNKSKRDRLNRMDSLCKNCSWFGACSGFYVGEATPEQRWKNANGQDLCAVVNPFLNYVEKVFFENGLLDKFKNRFNLEDGKIKTQDAQFLFS